MQSSARVTGASGAAVATHGYDDRAWYTVAVPATVMAGLLQNDYYPDDLFYGVNLQSVNASEFNVPWWFRCEFRADPLSRADSRVRLLFKGINYRADLWVNGMLVANSTEMVGSFRHFVYDITELATYDSAGVSGVIALQIYKPHDNWRSNSSDVDLAISFIDWAPDVPDANMGLWQDVLLEVIDGPVSVDYPLVSTLAVTDSSASLMVMAELTNGDSVAVAGTLFGSISGVGTFKQAVTMQPNSVTQVIFNYTDYPVLNVRNPLLWYPWQMGDQYMYSLDIQFILEDDSVSDALTASFGIRTIQSYKLAGNRVYEVNGKKILIRGAGWCPDLFQRFSAERQESEMRYVREMNLNTIRFEGKFESNHLYDLADQYGILMIAGYACCDAWQRWSLWGPEQHTVARESTRTQVKRLRIHPSVFEFWYGSDEAPPPAVEEQDFLPVFASEQWPVAHLCTAADRDCVEGNSGVHMGGPYSFVTPNFWYTDPSGARGFFTEGGPGENPLTYESLVETIPPDHLWPIDAYWNYHMTNGHWKNLDMFNAPLDSRYGVATNAADYSEMANLQAFEGMRAFFEAYTMRKYNTTGVIQWMLNSAWPEMIWRLYDYYLNPSATYFATMHACEPLHPQYSYDDGSLWVVNNIYSVQTAGLTLTAVVTDWTGVKQLWQKSFVLPEVPADSAVKVGQLPSIAGLTTTYFLRLTITDKNEPLVSNLYWLSTAQDNGTAYCDFTPLLKLPAVQLKATLKTLGTGDNETVAQASVLNPQTSASMAFFVRLRLTLDGHEVLPVFWSDNYFSLQIGEEKTVTVTYPSSALRGEAPVLLTEVYNNYFK
eukprot:TRINITY_DN3367_c0_g1_i2.p1 TRINITY_DN3367_c0_g1~~TRINITY_DN3367_c0_g1_i2.p1  ORF type:complete len:859 (+),score=161.34 TRINITY_DN3367_c0_g1_i2:95-2578(+)